MDLNNINESENLAFRTEVKNNKLHVEKKSVSKKVLRKHKPKDYKRDSILQQARKSAHNSVANTKRDISNEVRSNSTLSESCTNIFETFDFIEESTGTGDILTFEVYNEPKENQEIMESLSIDHSYYDAKYLTIGMAEGCFAPIASMSRNKRIYDEDHYAYILDNEIILKKIAMRAMLGTIGHHAKRVDDEDLANDLCSHVVTCLEIREKEDGTPYLYGRFEILNTTAGRRLRQLYEHGIPLYVSSRGGGKLLNVPGETYKRVDKKNYHLETFDVVREPGFLEAKPVPSVTGIVHESLDEDYNGDLLMKKTNEVQPVVSEEAKVDQIIVATVDNAVCPDKKEEVSEEVKTEEVVGEAKTEEIVDGVKTEEVSEEAKTEVKVDGVKAEVKAEIEEAKTEEDDKKEDDKNEVDEELDTTCEKDPAKEAQGEEEACGNVVLAENHDEHPADCDCDKCKADKELHREDKEKEEVDEAKTEEVSETVDFKTKYEALEPVVEELLQMIKDASVSLQQAIQENKQLSEKLEVSEDSDGKEENDKVDDSDDTDGDDDVHESVTEEVSEEAKTEEVKDEVNESEAKAEELGEQIAESINGLDLTTEKVETKSKPQVFSVFRKEEDIPTSRYFSVFNK